MSERAAQAIMVDHRWFCGYNKKGHVKTAWSLAGAKLFLVGGITAEKDIQNEYDKIRALRPRCYVQIVPVNALPCWRRGKMPETLTVGYLRKLLNEHPDDLEVCVSGSMFGPLKVQDLSISTSYGPWVEGVRQTTNRFSLNFDLERLDQMRAETKAAFEKHNSKLKVISAADDEELPF